jgi:glycosyltransferase involved in cell wall biosynthesis
MQILHVTESMGAGVATAIGQYVERRRDLDHRLLARVREDSFSPEPWMQGIPHVLVPGMDVLLREWLRARQTDVDVVHAHSTVAGQLTRLLPHPRARTVYSPHGLAAVHHRRRTVRSVLSVSERILAARTSALAAVSASEEDDLRAVTHGLPISRLPHAQDVSETVVPRALRSETVLAVGRLAYQKAPDTVASLPERLAERGVRSECVWVGDGDAAARALLERHGWTVTGWVDSAEVGRLVASAAVLLHPARYEGFSLAVVEALSQGTPAVARRIPANAEFRGTVLFDTFDEAVDQLHEILTCDDAWATLSAEAVDYIAHAHGCEAQASALSELYGEVVAS